MEQRDLFPDEVPESVKTYLAGFFDGEGTVCIYADPRSGYQYKVSLSNTDPRPLFIVQEWFGGRVRKGKSKQIETREFHIWRWERGGVKALPFLMAIFPHLVVKKEQADIFIKIVRMYTRPGGRKRSQTEVAQVIEAAEQIKNLKRTHLVRREE